MSVRSILAMAAISMAAPIYGATLADLSGAEIATPVLDGSVSGGDTDPFDPTGLSMSGGSTIEFDLFNDGGSGDFPGSTPSISGDVVDAPEPGAIPIVAAGILILALVGRRRRRR